MIKPHFIIYHSLLNQRAHRRNLLHGITSKKIHYDRFRDRSKIQHKTLKFLRKSPSQITFNVIFFGLHNAEFLNFLKKLQNLRKIQLHFPGSRFESDSGLHDFKKRLEKRIVRHKRLTHLHIEWMNTLPPDQKFLRKISSLRNLKVLQFRKIPDDPTVFTTLNTGLASIYKRNTWPCIQIQDFHFFCNTIYYEMMIGDIKPLSDAVNQFMKTVKNRAKTYLRLNVYWETADTHAGYINLAELIKEIRESLTHLEITGNILESSIEKYLAKNPACPNLSTLKLSARDPLEPAALYNFLNHIVNQDNLKKLELPLSLTKNLSSSHPQRLLAFNHLQNLRNLRIDFGSNQNWNRQLFSEFSTSLTHLPHLIALHISFLDELPAVLISQEDHLELFEPISKLYNLKKFSLLLTNRRQSRPEIIQGLFDSISMALKSLINLTHLNLDFGLAPQGIPFLLEAFPFLQKLEKFNLFLTRCQTSPEVFKKLLESLSSQKFLANVKMRYDLSEVNDLVYKALSGWTEELKFMNHLNLDLKAVFIQQIAEKKIQYLASQLGKRMIVNLNCRS